MDQARKDRFAKNEAGFRSINETLEEGLRQTRHDDVALAGFVCECGDRSCDELVHLELDKYEEVRRDSRRFVIVPGHDIKGVEDVIEHGERYAVVQKREEVRDVVEALDARR